ncbi:hypothetical protein SAMN04488061_0154 [Filomicrobium insigne]|uniref:Uncharacterized protein n=1 Tax=Filomicrobium insigne TaxID=418854 RepID=A0A1H0GGV2_9HYPH|nr:hypothetical protein SAMN04488061_0154 [Filomicrobium insigne]
MPLDAAKLLRFAVFRAIYAPSNTPWYTLLHGTTRPALDVSIARFDPREQSRFWEMPYAFGGSHGEWNR